MKNSKKIETIEEIEEVYMNKANRHTNTSSLPYNSNGLRKILHDAIYDAYRLGYKYGRQDEKEKNTL
jgi:hypothetical protein